MKGCHCDLTALSGAACRGRGEQKPFRGSTILTHAKVCAHEQFRTPVRSRTWGSLFLGELWKLCNDMIKLAFPMTYAICQLYGYLLPLQTHANFTRRRLMSFAISGLGCLGRKVPLSMPTSRGWLPGSCVSPISVMGGLRSRTECSETRISLFVRSWVVCGAKCCLRARQRRRSRRTQVTPQPGSQRWAGLGMRRRAWPPDAVKIEGEREEQRLKGLDLRFCFLCWF